MSKIDDLIKKAQTAHLTDEEQKEIFQILQTEMAEFKKKEPEKYLDLLKTLNAAIKEANKVLS